MTALHALQLTPFRPFFSLGILCGLMGVGHWVFWSVGWTSPVDIALLHAALQSQGFLAFFAIGFLLTAFPRFAGADPVTPGELFFILGFSLVFFAAIAIPHWIVAETAFLGLSGALIFFGVKRFRARSKKMPPSFILLGLGGACAFLGTALILGTRFGTVLYPLFYAARQMVQVGFLLLAVLGMTGQLAPYLLGYQDDPQAPIHHRSAAGVNLSIGLVIVLSFFMEPFLFRTAWGLRALAATVHLVLFARILRPLKKKTAVMFFFYLSCWMVPLGLWTGFFFPAYRLAALHILFIGGFSLMILSFGLLVTYSHTGQAKKLNEKLLLFRAIGVLIVGALVTRVLADLFQNHFTFLIHLSSGAWFLGVALWGGALLPSFLRRPRGLE